MKHLAPDFCSRPATGLIRSALWGFRWFRFCLRGFCLVGWLGWGTAVIGGLPWAAAQESPVPPIPPIPPIPPTELQAAETGDGADNLKTMDSSNWESLQLTSRAFRAAIEKIKPCLVTIESYGGVRTFAGRIGGIRKQGDGPTTGVMLTHDGYILTSTFNFIQSQPLISVITPDGQRHNARLVGRDDIRKICLLKIENVSNLPTPEIARLDEMQVGQWALSVGIGFGDVEPAMARGILSAKNRIGGRAIQTDANTSPANYGGPLIDIQGRVMGICVPLNPQSQAIGAGVEWYDSGIGFAIPLDGNESLFARLKQGERIAPAFLGIQGSANPQVKGVSIQQTVPNSPAAGAGLTPEDVIIGINGQQISDLLGLKQIIDRLESGTEVRLQVLKGGTLPAVDLRITLAAPPRTGDEFETQEPPEIR
jgi:serine protease Do